MNKTIIHKASMYKIMIHNYNYHSEPQKRSVVTINTKKPLPYIKLLLKEYEGWHIEVWRKGDRTKPSQLQLEGTLDEGCLECEFN